MTRNGKIARLPLALRTELNQRLQDGCPGVELIEWLNALPDVQAILQKYFNGQPISEVNLSRWKNGGFVTWEQEQMVLDRMEAVSEPSETGADAKSDPSQSMVSRFTSFLILQMAVELARMDAQPSGPEKAAIHTEIAKNLWLLRRCDMAGAKARLDEQKYRLGLFQEGEHERKRRKQQEHDEMTPEEREERIRIILGTELPPLDGQ